MLLIFDRGFSKIAIVGPIYLHDALLLFATFISFHRMPLKIKHSSVLLLLIISFIYLIISILFFGLKGEYFLMIFRHYFLFFYLICCYFLANKFFSREGNVNRAIKFILKIAKWSIKLQLLYFCFLFLTEPNYSPFKGFSYVSALGVMGIITYGSYILIYHKGLKRTYLFLFSLVISMMLGHSSAFLSIFAIYLVNFFLSFSPKQRLITLTVIFVLIMSLFLLPQFNDVNVGWRLLYWKHILDVAFFEKFFFFGNGFGKPFMTEEFSFVVVDEIGSRNMAYKPMARWLSPPHNSFLTIIFHVGFIPFLLLLLPLKKMFSQLFVKFKTKDKEELFLMYTLIGCSVWSSFNVILELPHSAIYFWLIYFTYIYYGYKRK